MKMVQDLNFDPQHRIKSRKKNGCFKMVFFSSTKVDRRLDLNNRYVGVRESMFEV